jgi:hypothetical protein
MGQALRLLGKLGAVEGWVPAGPAEHVRGPKAHGKTSNGSRRRETRTPFLHTLFRGVTIALLITLASFQIGRLYRIEESD